MSNAITELRTTKSSAARMRELEAFAIDPRHYDRLCTFGAISVWQEFGGEIYGYWFSDNPECVVGKSSGQGHDFAIVDGRYLVDAWAAMVEGLPIGVVHDLKSKLNASYLRSWYGQRDKWLCTRTHREWLDWRASC